MADKMYISLNERDGQGGLNVLGVYEIPSMPPPSVILKGSEAYTPKPWLERLVKCKGTLDDPLQYVLTNKFMIPAGQPPLMTAGAGPVEYDTARYLKGRGVDMYRALGNDVMRQAKDGLRQAPPSYMGFEFVPVDHTGGPAQQMRGADPANVEAREIARDGLTQRERDRLSGKCHERRAVPAQSPRGEWAKNSGGYDKDKFNHGS